MTYKILVVEDHPVAQRIAQMILEKLHCEVDLADTGLTALSKAEENHYDLIFMDIGLPDIDGIELTRKIRASEHITQQPPIIALTANFNESHKSQCLTTGMNDLMLKPLTRKTAQAMIAKWVNV